MPESSEGASVSEQQFTAKPKETQERKPIEMSAAQRLIWKGVGNKQSEPYIWPLAPGRAERLENRVREATAQLPPAERQVLEAFYGIDKSGPKSMSEVGQGMWMDKNKVRYELDKAVRDIQKVAPDLEDFLPFNENSVAYRIAGLETFLEGDAKLLQSVKLSELSISADQLKRINPDLNSDRTTVFDLLNHDATNYLNGLTDTQIQFLKDRIRFLRIKAEEGHYLKPVQDSTAQEGDDRRSHLRLVDDTYTEEAPEAEKQGQLIADLNLPTWALNRLLRSGITQVDEVLGESEEAKALVEKLSPALLSELQKATSPKQDQSA
jgi:hypothetical protein